MFCKNCGAQIDDNAVFCPNCGQNPNADPQPQAAPAAPAAPVGEAKSKMVAGLLGIFLGAFGVHNFYIGNTKRAVLQLLISLLTCGFGAFPMEIWGLIEGIFILMGKEGYTADAKGIPFKD